MNPTHPSFIKAAVIVVIVAAILGALTVMAGPIGPGSAKMFAVSLSLIIYSITATICLVATRKPANRALGNAGMAASAAGFLFALIIVIAEVGDEGFLKLAFILFIASIALAHICLLHSFTLQNQYAFYARTTATVAITLFSFLLIIRIFEPLGNLYSLALNQSALKLIFASLVVDLAATVLVPLCNRLETITPAEQHISSLGAPDEPVQTQEQLPAE